MRKEGLFNFLFLLLLVTLATSALLISSAKANPYMGVDWVEPPDGTKPPTLEVLNSTENAIFNKSSISLNFSAQIGNLSDFPYARLMNVSYTNDWQPGEFLLYNNPVRAIPYDPNEVFVYSVLYLL